MLVEDDSDRKYLILRHMPINEISIDHVDDGSAALDYLFRHGDYSHMKAVPLPDLCQRKIEMSYFLQSRDVRF